MHSLIKKRNYFLFFLVFSALIVCPFSALSASSSDVYKATVNQGWASTVTPTPGIVANLTGAAVVFINHNKKLQKVSVDQVRTNVFDTNPDCKQIEFDASGNLYVVFSEKQTVGISVQSNPFQIQATENFILVKINPTTNAMTGIDKDLIEMVWNRNSVSPNIQFDGSGNLYYLAKNTEGNVVLRKYISASDITDYINENISVHHWLARTDGTVIIGGQTTSTGINWLRKVPTDGNSTSYLATYSTVGWVLDFPDNRVYTGIVDSAPNEGVYKLSEDLSPMNADDSKSPYIGFADKETTLGVNYTPEYDVTALAAGKNATYCRGLTDTGGATLFSYGLAGENKDKILGLTGEGQYRTILYYYPTPQVLSVTLLTRVSLMVESLGELVISGIGPDPITGDPKNKLILKNLTSGNETDIMFQDLEIYNLDVLTTGTILFDALDFSKNEYIVGMFERAAGAAGGDVSILYGYKELAELDGKADAFSIMNQVESTLSVAVTSPTHGSDVSGIVDITATVTADNDVTKVEFFVDGELGGTDMASPFQYSWNTIGYANGYHTLKAKVTDSASQTAEDQISVEVDNVIVTQYTLTLATGTGGTTDPAPGAHQYNSGTEVAVSATPETGYTFAGWTGDVAEGHENDNPFTVTMDSNKTLTASFSSVETYTLSGTVSLASAAGEMSIQEGLSGVLMSGLPENPQTDASGNYTATVNHNWSGTVTPTKVGYTFSPATRTYSEVASDQTSQDYTATLITYTLTISSGTGGTTVPTAGAHQYNSGAEVAVSATPDAGYTFAGWTGDVPEGNENDNPLTVTMDSDKTLTASFALLTPPKISLSTTQLNFGAITSGTCTPPQQFRISNTGGGALDWSVADDAAWLTCLSASATGVSSVYVSGTGNASITVSVDPTDLASGTYAATIQVTSTNASNSSQAVSVSLIVKDSSDSTQPFGSFDTPVDGTSGVSGAIPVTGWVVDDIGVESVKIYRDPVDGEATEDLVYIGVAGFVEGARRDVEGAYPDYPESNQAGWGYMMLTNFLPNQGNGTYILHSIVTDRDGHQVSLGTKTIQCDNNAAVKPFGTIDTPIQGGEVSGLIWNAGWALTPQTCMIPTDGSTLWVWINGVRQEGHPDYNQYRVDIATLFPGLKNTDGAVGAYLLDTSLWDNGVHTIAWSVKDDCGRSEGLGSRFFTIMNAGTTATAQILARDEKIEFEGTPSFEHVSVLPVNFDALEYRRGFRQNVEPEQAHPDEYGQTTIEISEVERVEIDLGNGTEFKGYEVVGTQLRPLPIGSTLDAEEGVFYWQPGPGFLGKYELVFFQTNEFGMKKKISVQVRIIPKINY